MEDQSKMNNQTEFIYNMCMALGIHKATYQKDKQAITHMPISYYPYQISEQVYMKLHNLHRVWQKLILAISVDKEFVNETFKKTANQDEFVHKILQLYNKHQTTKLGVVCTRVDYMGDQHPQLVEFNTISVGLTGMSDYVQKLASMLKKHRTQKKVHYPLNKNLIQLVNSIQQALYVSHKKTGIILMVVHQNQFNFGDQNAFQLQLLKRGYQSQKATMKQIIKNLKRDQKTNEISYCGNKISVVYFRTAYSPVHYFNQDCWKVRQQIQSSSAIVIPTFAIQLVNFKRMQVQLGNAQVLKKYLTKEQVQALKSVQGDIYHFQNVQQSQKLMEQLKQNKQEYVLKSNREGGGNNYFGQDVYNHIMSLKNNSRQIQRYILMKKIPSTFFYNIFISNRSWKHQDRCTAQFSTFGAFAYSGNQIIYNQCGGSLIRIKKLQDNQGGIARDLGVISGCAVINKL